MDIDNDDQFDLYKFVFEYDINDGNVQVWVYNLKSIQYQYKDD